MGMTNSPVTFQRLMPTCLNNIIFQILLAYLDDIIVYSNTFYEHIERLDSVHKAHRTWPKAQTREV